MLSGRQTASAVTATEATGASLSDVGDRTAKRGHKTPPMRVITPDVSVWRRTLDIWRYRELVVGLVRKELKVKYKNSILGFMWSMLNPAMYLGVYYFVFQIVLGSGIPLFAIYLLCGLLVWNMFQTAVSSATTAVVGNASIVKKVAFPREILALASVGAALVFFFLQGIVLVISLIAFHVAPALSYLPLLILALVAVVILASALGVFLSAVNVYLRDVQHLIELVMVAWFWANPIVYPYQLIAGRLSQHHLLWVYFLNPVTPIVLTFQRALYAKVSPVSTVHGHSQVVQILPTYGLEWYLFILLGVIAVSCALFIGALVVFGHLEGNFAEEL
ncbi:MAG: ABC transporter [Acidimicrobiales bacterium]|nr:MAG: ABC transporter [Acidimicrobiales bacterium]